MKRLGVWLALTAVSIGVGFVLAFAALGLVNAVLPPFQFPEDDDSLRDYGPVLIAYSVWGLTSLVGSVLAWRWVNERY